MKSSAAKGNESGGRCSLAARASRCGRHLSSIKEAPTGSPPRRASEVYGCGRAQPRMVSRAGFFRPAYPTPYFFHFPRKTEFQKMAVRQGLDAYAASNRATGCHSICPAGVLTPRAFRLRDKCCRHLFTENGDSK